MGAAHGVMGPPRAGTAHDIRYTRTKDNSTLYAIMLGWDDGQTGVDLSLLSSQRIDGTKLKSVELMAHTTPLRVNLSHTGPAVTDES